LLNHLKKEPGLIHSGGFNGESGKRAAELTR